MAKKTTKKTASQLSVKAEKLLMKRFAGVALGGGKTEKTALCILEYYPSHKKLFLRKLYERVGPKGNVSSDSHLVELLAKTEKPLTLIAFDAALQLPHCLVRGPACPGVEKCRDAETKWMWAAFEKRKKTKRPNKIFTPYTERCAEIYIRDFLEESFDLSHALGSNAAPLTARALHIINRLKKAKYIEFFPKLSLWRIGRSLDIQKSHLRFHRHAVGSEESRERILKILTDKEILFIYEQDRRYLIDFPDAFDALLGALTAFLRHRNQNEKPPANFPQQAGWIEFPKETIEW